MASTAAKGKRKFETLNQLDEVVARLSARFGVERVGRTGRPIRDKELKEINRLEQITEFLIALDVKTADSATAPAPQRQPKNQSGRKNKPEVTEPVAPTITIAEKESTPEVDDKLTPDEVAELMPQS